MVAIPTNYLQPMQTVGIVYWGRSGTLLVHSLLDSHPDVLSCNAYFWHYSSHMDVFLASNPHPSADQLLDFICDTYWYLFEHWPPYFPEMFRGQNRDLRFGTDRERFRGGFRDYLAQFPEGVPFQSLPKGFTIHSFVLQAIHVAYAIAQGQALTSDNPTIVWQAHFWQGDYFRQRFPALKILSAVRHPLRSYDAWQVKAFNDERVPPFWYYHCLRLRQMVEFVRVPADLAERCRAIRFEDIHNRTELVMRALASWLNIRWDERLLKSTFDGESYWAIKGGCNHLVKAGDVPPGNLLVTGTRAFDESKFDFKHLGVLDRLRMAVLCREAFQHWQYRAPTSDHRLGSWLRRSRSVLLLLPSKLDRKCFLEDLKLDLAKLPRWATIRQAKAILKSIAQFVLNKFRLRAEILELKRAQANWHPITAVYLPDEQQSCVTTLAIQANNATASQVRSAA